MSKAEKVSGGKEGGKEPNRLPRNDAFQWPTGLPKLCAKDFRTYVAHMKRLKYSAGDVREPLAKASSYMERNHSCREPRWADQQFRKMLDHYVERAINPQQEEPRTNGEQPALRLLPTSTDP